jgi:hypothetical protein
VPLTAAMRGHLAGTQKPIAGPMPVLLSRHRGPALAAALQVIRRASAHVSAGSAAREALISRLAVLVDDCSHAGDKFAMRLIHQVSAACQNPSSSRSASGHRFGVLTQWMAASRC